MCVYLCVGGCWYKSGIFWFQSKVIKSTGPELKTWLGIAIVLFFYQRIKETLKVKVWVCRCVVGTWLEVDVERERERVTWSLVLPSILTGTSLKAKVTDECGRWIIRSKTDVTLWFKLKTSERNKSKKIVPEKESEIKEERERERERVHMREREFILESENSYERECSYESGRDRDRQTDRQRDGNDARYGKKRVRIKAKNSSRERER